MRATVPPLRMPLKPGTQEVIDRLSVDRTPQQDAPRLKIDLPSFSEVVRDRLAGVLVSNMWWEDRLEPTRVYRPTMDRFGPGGHLTMPLAASWLSSGPRSGGNTVAFPTGVDRTFVEAMIRAGILGKHAYMEFRNLPDVAAALNAKIYSVDDLPEAWDPHAANRSELHRLVNTKKYLRPLSAWAADYELVDLDAACAEDFERIGGGKRVYVKLNNTENTGDGVRPVDTAEQYMATVREIKAQADAHGLDRQIAVQPQIQGRNHSFQFVMRPGDQRLGLIALSNQRVADDGVTYAGSENLPLTPEAVTPELAAVMTDMAARIRAIDPEAFGCVMCDYFTTPDGRILTFDPGLRPTGNTATALARMRAEEELGMKPLVSEFFFVPTTPTERSYDAFSAPLGKRIQMDNIVQSGWAIQPWGYNQHMGRGPLIAIGTSQRKLREAIDEATAILQESHG